MIIEQERDVGGQMKFRSGKELIIYSKKFAIEDRKKSWYYTFSTMVFLILSFMGTYYSPHWGIKLFFSVLFGLFIVKLFVIYHDYQHKTILQKSKLAEIIMVIFGVFVLAPPSIWRRTHDHHHHNNSKLSNSGIGSYPLLSKNSFNQLNGKERFIYLAARHPITIFLGYVTLFLFDFNVKSILKSPKNHWDSFAALAIHISIAVALYYYGGISALILSWILPFVIANGFGAYLFYAQHNFPGAKFKENKNWDYANAAVESTSFLVMGPILNWFTGNIGYHHVHHINHRIPFYRLKEAMHDMPELHHPKTTTLRPKDVIACLNLKVWDPEMGQMTGI